MDPDVVLARGRRAAGDLMRDTFRVLVPTGGYDVADDGLRSKAYAARGTTDGKLQGTTRDGSTSPRKVSIGGVQRDVIESGLHLPWNADMPAAGDFGVGWQYELIRPGRSTPLGLVGSRWLVDHVPLESWSTALRLDVVRLA